MKTICLIVLASFFMMSFTVQAEDMTKAQYQLELSAYLNQYDRNFDNCFPKLPSDFPSLPDNFTELDERINKLELNKWYHRKIPYFNTEIDEIFFTFKTEMSLFAIRVAYLYNAEESKHIIYAVHFYETIDGINGELWHMETLPLGVSQESLSEISICGTPGFMLVSIITALFIVIVGIKYYKKR